MEVTEAEVKGAVKDLRARLGVDNSTFARMLGKSGPTFARYLGEKNPAPPTDSIVALANIAIEHRYEDLALIFRQYLLDSLRDISSIVAWEPGQQKPSDKTLAFESSEADNLELSEEVRKYLTMCVAVLRSGDDDALNAVRSNLRLFYRVVGGDPDDVRPLSIFPAKRARTRT